MDLYRFVNALHLNVARQMLTDFASPAWPLSMLSFGPTCTSSLPHLAGEMLDGPGRNGETDAGAIQPRDMHRAFLPSIVRRNRNDPIPDSTAGKRSRRTKNAMPGS